MSLRIVRVIPFHEPAGRFGGVVTQAALTSRSLAARGHRITVLTSDLDVDPDIPRGVPVDRGGLEVVYAPATRLWHREPPYASPLSAREFDAVLADADVLMLNVGLTLWNRTAAKAARRAGVGYVYNAEGCLCPTRLAVKRLRKAIFVRRIETSILRGASRLIAVTPRERENYMALGADAERITVVPNGVPIPPPLDADSRARGRRMLDVHGEMPLVLFFGRLDPLKGIDLLLEAARIVAREGASFEVVIVGPDYGCRAEIEKLAAALPVRARVYDAVHGTDRDLAFAAADVFALTSRSEGLPNAVLEAASFGLPCLVTHACGVPEVEQWGAGAVVDAVPAAIAAALRDLVTDASVRARHGVNAHRMALEAFSIDRVVALLETVLTEVASGQ